MIRIPYDPLYVLGLGAFNRVLGIGVQGLAVAPTTGCKQGLEPRA